MPNNHVVGSDRRKVSHQEYCEHLFKVASKLSMSGEKAKAKAIFERAAVAVRQLEEQCEVCNPNRTEAS